MQEELAFALEMLGLHDEALVQYDELDAMFTQFILNSQVGSKQMSYFNNIANYTLLLFFCRYSSMVNRISRNFRALVCCVICWKYKSKAKRSN